MSNINDEFKEFLEDWDSSFKNSATGYKPVYRKTGKKKDGTKTYRNIDSVNMMDQLDTYLNAETTAEREISDKNKDEYPKAGDTFRNVWEFLEAYKIDKNCVERMVIDYYNLQNVIRKLTVYTIEGHEMGFEGIKLEEK